ncbi:MFS transporter [Actinoplanes sp. ATCC 53533]|uniref:MFS transporter n=1 Tax=Actinoplanes sp. ATCC 53533 TaxID=1288362 RepID=UPI00131506C8|nr:MFS transporter [Actinoplanes sp. ATCC 53533]
MTELVTGARDLRQFGVLAAGFGVSTFGNFLNLVAVNLYVFQLSGSALWTGLLMAVRLAAGFLAGPVAGRLAAHADRRRVMVCADVAQALAMVALLVSPPSVHAPMLLGVAVVLGAGNTLFTVALRTSVPDLVGPAARIRGNGYLVTAKSFAMVLGFAAAGPLVTAVGYRAAFAVNAASFVVSAVILLSLPLSFRATGKTAGPASTSALRSVLKVVLATSPTLAVLLALRGVEGWGSASHNVALPVFAGHTGSGDPAVWLSQFWTAWAVGSLSVYQALAWWLRRTGREPGGNAYAMAIGLASVAFIASFTGLPWPFFLIPALIAGFTDGAAELFYTTRLQDSPDNIRGLLFGASASVETLGLASGMVVSAVLLDVAKPVVVVSVFHGSVVLAACSYLFVRRRHRC